MDALVARFWEWVAAPAQKDIDTWEYTYISHLLSQPFREHLPPELRGTGSEKRVYKWLATLPGVEVLMVEEKPKRAFRVLREAVSEDHVAVAPSAHTRVPVMEPAPMDERAYYDILSGAWVTPELALEIIFSGGRKPNPAPPSIPPPYYQSEGFAQGLVACLKDCWNFLEVEAAAIPDPVNLLVRDPHGASRLVASRPCRGGQVLLTRADFLREVRTACKSKLCWPGLPANAQEAHRSPREKSVAAAKPPMDLDACQVPVPDNPDLDVELREEQIEAIQKANTVNAVFRRNIREAMQLRERGLRLGGFGSVAPKPSTSAGEVVIGETQYAVPKIVNITKGMTVFAEWDGCLYGARVLEIMKSRLGKVGAWKVLLHFIGHQRVDDRWMSLASLRIPAQFVGRSLETLPLDENEVADQMLKDAIDSNVKDSDHVPQGKDEDADELDTSNGDDTPIRPKKFLKVTAKSSPGSPTTVANPARRTSASSSSGATDQSPFEVKARNRPLGSGDAHALSPDHGVSCPPRPTKSCRVDPQTPEPRAKAPPWRWGS